MVQVLKRPYVLFWVLFFAFALEAPAETSVYPISKDIPTVDDTASFEKLVQTIRRQIKAEMLFDVDVYETLFSAHRYRGIFLFVQALHEKAPELDYVCNSYGLFVNPISSAYEQKQFDLVKSLIELDPKLLNRSNQYLESTGTVPLTLAVEAGDLEWIQKFIEAGADVNTTEAKAVKGGTLYPINLLTVSSSSEVDKILLKYKIHTEFQLENPIQSHCIDDRVRLRKEPNTSSDILAVVSLNAPLTIVGGTYKTFTVGTQTGRWIQVVYQGKKGWIFEAFVFEDYEP